MGLKTGSLSRHRSGENVGVLEVGRRLDFAEEAISAECGGELGAKNLDGDLAIVLQVVGEIDSGHAAGPEFALDAVTVSEGAIQRCNEVGHRRLSICATQMSPCWSPRVK